MSPIPSFSETDFKSEPGVAGRFIETVVKDGQYLAIRYKNEAHFNFAYDVIDVLAAKKPDEPALIHVAKDGKDRIFTFRDLSTYANKTANYLSYLGVKRGDRVLLVLKRHYQFWFVMLALHKIGAVAIPATNLLVRDDFSYRIKAGQISHVIATSDGAVAKELDAAMKTTPGVKTKIIVGASRNGWHTYNKEVRFFSPDYKRGVNAPGGNDEMLMYFTSGTTSYPKLCVHNYLYPLGHYATGRFWHCCEEGKPHFAISDTGWAKAAWGKIYGQWLCEAVQFVFDYDDFYAIDILKMIEKYHVTTFCAPPTVYRVLVHMKLENYDLSSLHHVCTAGEALNTEVFERFKLKTGLQIMEGFGQSESTVIIGNFAGTTPKSGSMGKANPQYTVKLMKLDGTLCEPGETGEIVIYTKDGKPNGLTCGYTDKEKTAEIWHDDYYHTGDTATMDEDGYFTYVGRVDDVIKSTGYRVGPFEIENSIMQLPYVLECAVTAVPDKIRGQAIKASIVLTNGTQGTEKLRTDIFAYLKEHLASYKWPKIIDFVSSLPKTTTGKIRRAEIKQKDWQQ